MLIHAKNTLVALRLVEALWIYTKTPGSHECLWATPLFNDT